MSSVQLLGRCRELDKVTILEFDSRDAGENFLGVFPLRLNYFRPTVEGQIQAKEAAVVPGAVCLELGDRWSAFLRQQCPQLRIGRSSEST